MADSAKTSRTFTSWRRQQLEDRIKELEAKLATKDSKDGDGQPPDGAVDDTEIAKTRAAIERLKGVDDFPDGILAKYESRLAELLESRS